MTIDFPLPIIASNPHFLDADPIVSNAVDGMHPDSELHRSFGDVEPRTGSNYDLNEKEMIDSV